MDLVYRLLICKVYFLSLIPKRTSTALRHSGLNVRSLWISCNSFSVMVGLEFFCFILMVSLFKFKNVSILTLQNSAILLKVIASGMALPCSQPLKHCLVIPILFPNSVCVSLTANADFKFAYR